MLNLFQHLVCFFLLSADASFIPVHRKGFSDAILINIVAERTWKGETAMDIKVGDTFKNSWDGMDFAVKKIVNDMVVLQSQDGKRQILTGVRTLTSTSFYQRKGEEES